jgi:hypothetical protein
MANYIVTGTLHGASPLLQSSKQHQHPSDPLNRLTKPVRERKTKTEEDHVALAQLQFVASGHWSKDGNIAINNDGSIDFSGYERPFVPGDMLRASLKQASRALKNRKGAGFDRGVQILDDFELRYEGPKECRAMWDQGLYRNDGGDRAGKLIWITRVSIPVGWEIDFSLRLDSSQLEVSDLQLMIEAAGRYIGMGSWRPTCGGRFGRYSLDAFSAVEAEF